MDELKSTPEKLAYAKAYYIKNAERIKARRRERWKEGGEEAKVKQREYCRKYYHKNPTSSKERTIAWQKENREIVNSKARLKRYRDKGLTEAVEKEEKLLQKLLEEKQLRKTSK